MRYLKSCLLIVLCCVLAIHPTYATTTHHKKTHKHTSVKKVIHKSSPRKSHIHKKHKAKKTIRKKTVRVVHKPTVSASQINTPVNHANIHMAKLPNYALSEHEKKLVNYVRDAISSIQYSTYKMGGNRIDTKRGIYIVDCSAYIDHILKSVFPQAFHSLTSWSGSARPTTDNFYRYFSNLSPKSNRWESLSEIGLLRPGDIIVFRELNHRGQQTGGHVMVVMDKPKQIKDRYAVRISDSAPFGHSKDTRLHRISGVGIGTILLKANQKTREPIAYAWRENTPFKSNIEFAMARPRHVG